MTRMIRYNVHCIYITNDVTIITNANCFVVRQRITEEGCEPLTIHNKMCFGQCGSMFVPPNGGSVVHLGQTFCSRCGPSKARTVVVRMRCGSQVRERSVMLVEECKCETGREESRAEDRTSHL